MSQTKKKLESVNKDWFLRFVVCRNVIRQTNVRQQKTKKKPRSPQYSYALSLQLLRRIRYKKKVLDN